MTQQTTNRAITKTQQVLELMDRKDSLVAERISLEQIFEDDMTAEQLARYHAIDFEIRSINNIIYTA
jgi:hypothetical protein